MRWGDALTTTGPDGSTEYRMRDKHVGTMDKNGEFSQGNQPGKQKPSPSPHPEATHER